MKTLFDSHAKLLIGVVHLRPLPGSPRWEGNIEAVIEAAVKDACAYESGGAHALFIENFGDLPFTKGSIAPETLAAMAAAGRGVRAAVRLPIGFNVLRNDACAALGLCAACRGDFIRVNVLTGALLTDQGIIEGCAYDLLRYRRRVCPGAAIFADVHLRHALPLGDCTIEDSARDALERGLADALILCGDGDGRRDGLAEAQRVRRACPGSRLLLSGGVALANVADYLPVADGFIVGTSLKAGGEISAPVEAERVAALARATAG